MITDSVKTNDYLSLRVPLTKMILVRKCIVSYQSYIQFAGVLQAMVFEKLSILLNILKCMKFRLV